MCILYGYTQWSSSVAVIIWKNICTMMYQSGPTYLVNSFTKHIAIYQYNIGKEIRVSTVSKFDTADTLISSLFNNLIINMYVRLPCNRRPYQIIYMKLDGIRTQTKRIWSQFVPDQDMTLPLQLNPEIQTAWLLFACKNSYCYDISLPAAIFP